MDSLPFELLEDTFAWLELRDLARARRVCRTWAAAITAGTKSLTIEPTARTPSVDTVLGQFPNTAMLHLKLSTISHAPRGVRIDHLHAAARSFTGAARLLHLVTDSEHALAGARASPSLLTVQCNTDFSYDVRLDHHHGAPQHHRDGSGVLAHHGRNLARMVSGNGSPPHLRRVAMTSPIYWQRTTRATDLAELHLDSFAGKTIFALPSPSPCWISPVRELDLVQMPAWSMINLSTAFARGHFAHLQSLALTADLALPFDLFASLAAGCPALASLDLTHTRLTSEHFDDLVLLGGSLTALALRSVEFTLSVLPASSFGTNSLLFAILGHLTAIALPRLEQLEVRHCEWIVDPVASLWSTEATPMTTKPATSLASERLTHLVLHDLNDEEMSDSRAAAVRAMFPNLEQLDMHVDYSEPLWTQSALGGLARLSTVRLLFRDPPRMPGTLPLSPPINTSTIKVVVPAPLHSAALELWSPPSAAAVRSALCLVAPVTKRLIFNYVSAALASDLVLSLFEDPVPLPRLADLEISAISSHAARSVQRLACALASTPLPSLHRVHLESVYHVALPLDRATVSLLVSAAPKLRIVEMQGLALGPETLETLVRGWAPTVRCIELGGMALGVWDSQTMVSMRELARTAPNLSRMTLTVDHVDDSALVAMAAELAIPVALPGNVSVKPDRIRSTSVDSAVDLTDEVEFTADQVPESRRAAAGSDGTTTGGGFLREDLLKRTHCATIIRWMAAQFPCLTDVQVAGRLACRRIGQL
ncbi:hypothetical protein BC828DRAFT_381712 [Blastocladiella britannica]|nr:hypothetical protein BC828DRAFT_381712 [Blastocladiella britannica]